MPLNYDLHCHSTASDGELAPAALVRYAHTRGVQALALTDHDTTAGLAEAQSAAVALGMTLINGVEISVSWNERLIHIVGLGFDRNAPELLRGLADLRRQRETRGEEIGRRLAGLAEDGQVLVVHDMLGINKEFSPRFLRSLSQTSVRSLISRP